ncbi:MAG: hypothetical protein Q8P57_05295 [Candidatus Pacearchaeota archaeon]|nr:hypothetical protein [Candidatus Pacearchaeota archaeon]
MKIGYDILGNIALLKFNREASVSVKKKFALSYLKNHKNVSTVLEKVGKFSGRLRTLKTRWLAGEKTKEALYRENGCEFRFNVDTCYFSSRLSEERKDAASLVKKNENVLVMFGGVAPFAVIISKLSKAKRIVSVELGRECNKYAKINVKRNKLDNVEIVQGDVRKVCLSRDFGAKGFDRIVMARPNLKDSFLDVAFHLVKKGVIHYYGFCKEDDLEEMKEMVLEEGKKAGRKIRILKVKKAGDIGAYRYRYRVDLKVLN